MLIGQLTDIHIGFDRKAEREENLVRLETVVAALDGPRRPDILLLTGDLTEHGDPESFARLTAALAPSGIPCWPIPGNHDTRAGLIGAFPHITCADGFVQYVIELTDLRVIMLDTLDEGRHAGAFCEVRARWLANALAERPDTPTLIAMHHPPFPAGINWMDPDPSEPWIARFGNAVAGHRQIVGLTCGHVHRPAFSRWRGLTAMLCPSTAPALALDLTPVDPDQPDGRPLITDEGPGFALHRWDGVNLLSHLGWAEENVTLARHDARMQSTLRTILSERPTPL